MKIMPLLHARPKAQKKDLPAVKQTIDDFSTQDHHLVKKHQIYFLNRITSKKSYNILISERRKTSSRLYHQRKFKDNNFDEKISTCWYELLYKIAKYVLFSLHY